MQFDKRSLGLSRATRSIRDRPRSGAFLPADIQDRVLLAGKRGVGKVFGSRGRTHRDLKLFLPIRSPNRLKASGKYRSSTSFGNGVSSIIAEPRLTDAGQFVEVVYIQALSSFFRRLRRPSVSSRADMRGWWWRIRLPLAHLGRKFAK